MRRRLLVLHHHLRPPPSPPVLRRKIWSLATAPPALLAPLVFTGLTLTLWTYKCVIMVLFQSKIIYMPGIPLGARREKISTYAPFCRGIAWSASTLTTRDGKVLATVSTSLNPHRGNKPLLLVYFQGNASSTPPRLPLLSTVLSGLTAATHVLIPSYRGYWTSSGQPSQRGIESDLAAIFAHLARSPEMRIVLWGQSIGCGVLMAGLARHALPNVVGLVLETPFMSVREMLAALYPQRWLPYRYLGPFLWNRWELAVELGCVLRRGWCGRVLILEAGRDELVPEGQAGVIGRIAEAAGLSVARVRVEGALHVECMAKPKGRKAVVEFLEGVAMVEESPPSRDS